MSEERQVKLTDQELARRQKMEALQTQGLDPFGHAFKRTHYSGQIREAYGEKKRHMQK